MTHAQYFFQQSYNIIQQGMNETYAVDKIHFNFQASTCYKIYQTLPQIKAMLM